MRIVFKTRSGNDLISAVGAAGEVSAASTTTTTLDKSKLWANYALVTNDERVLMGAAPRDIVIEQHQMASAASVTASDTSKRIDIRFAHSVKAIFFGLRVSESEHGAGVTVNASGTFVSTLGDIQSLGGAGQAGNVRSHYSVLPKVQNSAAATDSGSVGWVQFMSSDGLTNGHEAIAGQARQVSPFTSVSLVYENTTRLGQMEPRFFEEIQPYVHGVNSAQEPGIGMYSYGLDVDSLDPCGSTNYGKLTNVSLDTAFEASTAGASGNMHAAVGRELMVTAVNWNVVRISGGALGFPVL